MAGFCVSGDATGLLKVSHLPASSSSKASVIGVHGRGKQSMSRSLQRVVVAGEKRLGEDDSLRLVAHRKGGTLEFFQVAVQRTQASEEEKSKSKLTSTITECGVSADFKNLIGLQVFKSHDDSMRLFTCSGKAKLQISKLTWGETVSVEPVKSFQVGPDDGSMCRAVLSHDHSKAATGGKEVLLKLWDLETSKSVFKARNVPHDELELRLPVWIKDIGFFPAASDPSGNCLVTGTAHHQIRVFDIRAGKRPIADHQKVSEYPITCLQTFSRPSSPSQPLVAFSDTHGVTRLLDIRSGRQQGVYRGFGGSVRHMDVGCGGDEEEPRLACVGLDRHLRVFDAAGRQSVHNVYLKQHVNTCALVQASGVVAEEEEEEQDELWAELNERARGQGKKRKRTDTEAEEDEE